MPLISVIVPAYNAEKTIRETVESVLHQTLTDLELIVVDDASQDSTLDVLAKIADPRLTVLSHPHNSGANRSRNLGLSRSTGVYVSFLDADDLWTIDKLESQLKALKAHPEAAVAYSWTDRIDETSQFLRKGGRVRVSGDVLAELLIANFLENGSNPLIRRDAAIAVGGFDESLSACQDWDLWLKLAAQYQFAVVTAPQILYRLSPNSVSSNVLALEAACVKVIDRAFTAAPDALQRLKKHSLGNVYKYLAFKSFEGYSDRKKGLAATRFLYHVVRNDPAMLRTKVIWKVLLNIVIVTLLPAKQTNLLRQKNKELTNINALLAHIRTNFSELIQPELP
jgi:glycosyltransferase involved in cell wall biosynthesis